jgi:peptidoglycan/xylan/chitin deacetylase (PgdA/CDA1 family)
MAQLTKGLIVGAALGAAAAHSAPAIAAASPPARRVLRIRDSVPGHRAVALTFDDGPHPQGTPAVLEHLAAAGARATFFLVGEQVARWPALAAELAAAGHAIALHGHTHRSHLRLRASAVAADLGRGAVVVADATAREPRLHRPPYGQYSAASLGHVRRAGLEPVLWSRHGRDWSARATPASIARRLGTGVAAGEVLLLHDADHYGAPGSWRRTVAALPRLLDALGEAGLELVELPGA